MILTPIPREQLDAALDRFAAGLTSAGARAAFAVRATSPDRAGGGAYRTPPPGSGRVERTPSAACRSSRTVPAATSTGTRRSARPGTEAYVILHEVAHFLLAPPDRRTLPDFGLGPGPDTPRPRRRPATPRPSPSPKAKKTDEAAASLIGIFSGRQQLGQPALAHRFWTRTGSRGWSAGWRRRPFGRCDCEQAHDPHPPIALRWVPPSPAMRARGPPSLPESPRGAPHIAEMDLKGRETERREAEQSEDRAPHEPDRPFEPRRDRNRRRASIEQAIAERFAASRAQGRGLGCRGSGHRSTGAGEIAGAIDLVADVTDPAGIAAALAATESRLGAPDILVNNAGVTGPNHPLDDYPTEAWRQVIEIDLVGVFNCCKAVVPAMRRRDYGRIVNIASIAGKVGNPNASAYSAAKAGVIGLTKSLGRRRQGTRGHRDPGQLRHSGCGQDRHLRPDDPSPDRLHAVEDSDGAVRGGR